MRYLFPVPGRVAALMASALLGGGLAAGCSQGESPAPGGQAASSPAAAASPSAPAAAESPAAATAEASPAAGGTQTAAAPTGGGAAERGQQLFAQNCATCHGPSGKGDGPAAAALNPKPQDLTDDQWKHGGSPEQIFQTITNGVPGTAMVSWSSLPEADRKALVAYVQSLQGK
jgi:high-affinity iron transporter